MMARAANYFSIIAMASQVSKNKTYWTIPSNTWLSKFFMYVCMYDCIYVMYVCLYVCMYVCMYACGTAQKKRVQNGTH